MDKIIDALEMSGYKYEQVNDNEVFLPNWESGSATIVYDPETGTCKVTQKWTDARGKAQEASGIYPARNVEAWFNY